MLTDPIFWYGLALKMVMTAGIVVAASLIVERSGPFIGALIASLPTAGGAALIILAVEHPPQFIAQGMIGSLIANAAGALFALSYATLAQRRSLAISLGGAFLVWFAIVALSRLHDWTIVRALALNVVIFPPALSAGRHFPLAGATTATVTRARARASNVFFSPPPWGPAGLSGAEGPTRGKATLPAAKLTPAQRARREND